MPKLAYVRPYDSPGYTRVRRGGTQQYRDARGRAVPASTRARLESLVVPPAWTEVWLATNPAAHILAVGLDEAGRRQYIYHPDWRRQRDDEKFERALALARALPAARRRASVRLAAPALSREKVLATGFRILDLTAMRIGGEEYATTNGSRGLCTLLCRHVRVDGDTVTFEFLAKSRQRASISTHDRVLAHAVAELLDGRGGASRLLAWRDGRARRPARTADINSFIRECTGSDFTAKDFRTLTATSVAAAALPAVPPQGIREIQAAILEATRAAAAVLGNTVAVARGSYIHPAVFELFAAGHTVGGSRSTSALLSLLARQ